MMMMMMDVLPACTSVHHIQVCYPNRSENMFDALKLDLQTVMNCQVIFGK